MKQRRARSNLIAVKAGEPRAHRGTLPTNFSAVDKLTTAAWVFDIDDMCILWANEAALRVWRAENFAELASREFAKDMSVSVANRLRQYQEDFERQASSFSELWTIYPKDIARTLRVIYSGVRLQDGRMAMFCEGVEHDASPETLRSAEALLHASVMISLYGDDGGPLYRNPAARADVLTADALLASRFVDSADYAKLRAALNRHGQVRRVARIRSGRGIRWHEITARQCRDAVTGSPAILLSEVDVSDLKETEEKANFLALHDILTGLPNRTFVMQKFQVPLEIARTRGEEVGLFFLDLDGFKNINDSLGHAIGDELLIEIAHRLRDAVGDTDVVARVGGDEFLVLVINIGDRQRLSELAERVRVELSRPVYLPTCELQITPSIGVSVFPGDGLDIATLMKSADLALYGAKDAGRNCHRYFVPLMKERAETRLEMESNLRRALQQNEFELFYQPRVSIRDGRIVGAEALLRWNHGTRGLVLPDQFISVCEETGFIEQIGTWVLETAARQQKTWEDHGHPISVSVNLSPRQFRNKGLVSLIQWIASRTGCNPSRIELEITESVIMGKNDEVAEALAALSDIGFSIAIDDFGTGYSNLAYIQRYPVKCIKIDRSFISSLSDNGAITELIIAMCKLMNTKIVAEGVETEEQLAWLQARDCHEYQGHLFSKPLHLADFNRLLETAKTAGFNFAQAC